MAKLEIADANLTELPADKFTAGLETIDASGNSITVLGAEVGNCENLEELLLFANQLKVLPKELGKLQKLKTLNLFNNKVMKLPVEVGTLGALEEARAATRPRRACRRHVRCHLLLLFARVYSAPELWQRRSVLWPGVCDMARSSRTVRPPRRRSTSPPTS